MKDIPWIRHVRKRALCCLALWFACLPALADDWIYRVRAGDTLWDLSGQYLKPSVPWQRLQEHNAIRNPYQLPPGSTLRIPLAWLHRQPAQAKVLAVRGDAATTIQGRRSSLQPGMALGSGALVETARDASLSLQFADGSRLLLLGDSELLLDRLLRFGRSGMTETRLRLQRGRIRNDVQPARGAAASFIVDTPSASSAVRGTEFRVESTAARSTTEVLEGRVAVSASRSHAMVKRGFGTVVDAGTSSVTTHALLPAPNLSRVPPRFATARPSLAWPAVDGAQAYRVQVAATTEFDALLVDEASTTPGIVLPALEAGAYHVRVRAVAANGLGGLDAQAQFRIDDQPEPPYTLAPAASSTVRTGRVALAWAQVPTAAAYEYEIGVGGDFTSPVARATVRGEHAAGVELAPGNYAWRIRSIDASGKAGPFGDALGFNVRPMAELRDIAPDRAAADGSMTFRWPAGLAGQSYRFQMSRKADFSDLHVDQRVDVAEITVPRVRGGTWYVRAQTLDADGFEGPLLAGQAVDVPCRLCRIGVGAGALLILLAL